MRQESLSFRVPCSRCCVTVGERWELAPALWRSQHRVPLGVLVRSEMHIDSALVTLSIIQPLCLPAGPGSDQVTGQEVDLAKDRCSPGIYKFTVSTVC